MKPEEVAEKDKPDTEIERIQEEGKPRKTTVKELADQVQKFNKKLGEAEKEESELDFEVDAPYGVLVGVSDLHYGNQNVNMEFVEKVLDFIKNNKYCWCFLNGDVLDNWTEIAPQGGIYEQTIRPEYQYEIMKEKLEPIKDSILAIIYGNHEGRSQKAGEENPMERLSKEFNIGYLGAGGRININLNGIEYKIHARHRYHYHSSLNPTHPCKRLIGKLDTEADVVAIGHNHDPVINKLHIDKPRTLIRYGSAMPSTRYSRYKGYPEKPLVAPSVLLSSETKQHDPLMNLGLAEDYLKINSNNRSNNNRNNGGLFGLFE